jgi:hypothetical protein
LFLMSMESSLCLNFVVVSMGQGPLLLQARGS